MSGGGEQGGDVEIEYAEHAGTAHRLLAARCAEHLVAHPPLSYLTHHSNGIVDFSVSALQTLSLTLPPDYPLVLAGTPAAAVLRRICEEVNLLTAAVDRQLQQALTGPLVRVVVQGPDGVVFCDQVLPRQHVVGVAVPVGDQGCRGLPLARWPAVRSVDQGLSQLVDELRDLVSLETMNLGGWLTQGPPQVDEGPVADEGPDPRVVRRSVDAPDGVEHELAGVLAVEGLHLVALYGPDGIQAQADILDTPQLSPFDQLLAATARRGFYADFGHGHPSVRRLGHVARAVTGEPVGRVVLDVAQGAVFVYRLDADRFLFGVTLKQRRVSQSDDRLADLALRLGS
jgi:hypothetical protein